MSDSREIVDTRHDPYAAHGAMAGGEGQFLSFKNGEFLYGQNSEELKLGTRLIANMAGLRWGWRCWKDKQMVDDRTELLSERHPTERRADLGDNDSALWERDNNGKPRDPWAQTYILELADGQGDKYLYSTSSVGGKKAIRALCDEYAREYRQRPGMLPIIELDRYHYNHSEFGKTYNPVLKIVGWTDEDQPSVDDAEEEKPAIAAPQGQRAANPTEGASAPASPTSMTRSPSNGERRAPKF